MIASDPPLLTRAHVLKVARSSGLLSASELLLAEATVPPTLRGPDTARALVSNGFITQFQAERLLAGKTDGFVLGQYLILEQVGSGVLTRVYQARHRAMNRLVAIKVLAQRTGDPARRAAFEADARAAAKLTHPNVVTVLDVNQVGERAYLVLDYVEGTTLTAFVRLRGTFTVARACELVRQAALGLQHAHEHGLAHGHLDPGVLLVGHPGGARGEKPVLKVAGFECGARGDRELGPDDADPDDYRAPELFAAGAAATVESDLYSLGCVFYFLLTGKPPIRGRTRPEKAAQHLSATPVPVGDLRPDLPPALAELIGALMAKAPAGRPLSAAEVAERLEPFAESDEPLARVEFSPTPGGGPASGFLSGLHAQPAARPLELDDPTPWTGLEGGTLDGGAEITSDAGPSPGPPERGPARLRLLVHAAGALAVAHCGAALAIHFHVGK
jgi:serine/threonine-protein kinase